MDDARDRAHEGHEVDERAVDDPQHVGGVTVPPDTIGLEPHEPGQQEHERRAPRLDEALERPLRPLAENPIDEVHDGVLVGERHQRQSGEDQHEQHQLGDLERAAHGATEAVAGHDVYHGEEHHGEEDGGSGDAEDQVGIALPPRGGRVHFPPAIFFSSSWNSARTLTASTPLALAFLIQSSMSGAERFRTSAAKAASAFTTLMPAFFAASRPLRSASSHETPAIRAMCSP